MERPCEVAKGERRDAVENEQAKDYGDALQWHGIGLAAQRRGMLEVRRGNFR